jgi:ABC-type lipoprotein export system ATPase subunit
MTLQADTKQVGNHPIIQVKNITFGFTSNPVISNYSMIAEYGQWISFMGPSGSGKTTFLQLLLGFKVPLSGEILIDGCAFSTLNEDLREKMRLQYFAIIYQDMRLIPSWNVFENVWLPLTLQGVKRSQAQERAEHWLVRVGMDQYANRHIHTLSGGQQQRVSIARALAKEPKILLADEPTGNLDKGNTERIAKLLGELCKDTKTTLICVTHDPFVGQQGDTINSVDHWL